MSALNIVIIGGHGKVAQRLTKLLTTSTPPHKVTSIIRSALQSPKITSLGATPLVLSLESSPTSEFTETFTSTNANVVYFIAGGGGKPGEGSVSAADRTRKVDFEGAVKVYDAIEAIPDEAKRPHLILVSAIDVRDKKGGVVTKVPAHYTAEDRKASDAIWAAIGGYMQAKYEADKNLVQRTGFKWTIVRPGGLSDAPGKGKADIGRTHLTEPISRDDVASILYKLAARQDAAGLAIDIVGGKGEIDSQLDEFIKKGVSDFLG